MSTPPASQHAHIHHYRPVFTNAEGVYYQCVGHTSPDRSFKRGCGNLTTERPSTEIPLPYAPAHYIPGESGYPGQ